MCGPSKGGWHLTVRGGARGMRHAPKLSQLLSWKNLGMICDDAAFHFLLYALPFAQKKCTHASARFVIPVAA